MSTNRRKEYTVKIRLMMNDEGSALKFIKRKIKCNDNTGKDHLRIANELAQEIENTSEDVLNAYVEWVR